MLKSKLEWYKELPEPYRSQAIENHDPDFLGDNDAISLYEAIINGFDWKNTPQGFAYWKDVCFKVDTKTLIPSYNKYLKHA